MTEAEWLAARDPTPMLGHLREGHHDRKLRLFAVACCRHVWHLLTDDRTRAAVECAEAYADGRADDASRQWVEGRAVAAWQSQQSVFNAWRTPGGIPGLSAAQAACVAVTTARRCVELAAAVAHLCRATTGRARDDARAERQADALRDVFGNPFRPVAFRPGWRTPTAVALATGIYVDRAFDRLPILADALEEAGCDAADVLGHCREVGGGHVRGCWVVDLVTGQG